MSIRSLRLLQVAFALPTFALMALYPLAAVPFAFVFGATCVRVDTLKSTGTAPSSRNALSGGEGDG